MFSCCATPPKSPPPREIPASTLLEEDNGEAAQIPRHPTSSVNNPFFAKPFDKVETEPSETPNNSTPPEPKFFFATLPKFSLDDKPPPPRTPPVMHSLYEKKKA